jgi:hypothetical protein
MSGNNGFSAACTEEFAELCALSTTNSLTADERRRLEQHVLQCRQCTLLLADYESLASKGMAGIAAVRDSKSHESYPQISWDREGATARFLSRLDRVPDAVPVTQPVTPRRTNGQTGFWGVAFPRMSFLLRAAAVVLVVAFAAYQFGVRTGFRHASDMPPSYKASEASLRQQLADALAQRTAIEQKRAANSETTAELDGRAAKAEKDLTELQTFKAALEAKAQDLGRQNQQQSASLATLSTDREALQQKVRDAEATLQKVRQDLTASQEERQRALLHSTNLETQVDRLSAQLRERDATTQRQGEYLASDRDVRELMGARQLYIADVFDVDPQGKTRKPFGRVFYTRAKSLIFYAFDLDREPGYREAKAFQAWGRPGSSQTTPVSLGIFYMDNESNRRWALKFDEPKVLEEINSVFVTVEPKGGSKRPTTKPFLVSYLHTAPPNHP